MVRRGQGNTEEVLFARVGRMWPVSSFFCFADCFFGKLIVLLAFLACLATAQVTATPNGGNCTVKACRQQARKGCNEIGATEVACRYGPLHPRVLSGISVLFSIWLGFFFLPLFSRRVQRTMECFAACGLQKDGTARTGAPAVSRAERALAAANANLRLALRLFALRDEAALGALNEAGDATTTASTAAAVTAAPFNPFTDATVASTFGGSAAASTVATTAATMTRNTVSAAAAAQTPAATGGEREALQAELAAVQAQIPDCKGEATCLADLKEVIKTIKAQMPN